MSTETRGLVERRRHLDPRPESARLARQMVLDVLAQAGRTDLADTATLLASELVTNAIVHARSSIVLAVAASPEGLRVAVHDRSPNLPTPRHYGSSATTGRGLELVELLADRHGSDSDPGSDPDGSASRDTAGLGKTVWFELGDVVGVPDEHTGSVPASRGAGGLTVRLTGLPVLLSRAWQQHADALLRELLLSRRNGDRPSGVALPGDQGAANEAFTAVASALEALGPVADLPSHVDIVLVLRDGSATDFAELDALLDHILILAESGQTLAPPTQPEVRQLRQWICRQVLDQAAGRAPQPWPGLPPDFAPPARAPVTWDPSQVQTSSEAMIAGDDANRIIAASPAAMELLGWDEKIIGKRLVNVIPPRLREAHIASFTMHLLSGETTILDREITVPALRRDGTELEVLLLVRRVNVPDGRAVFTARLRRR